ncbi:MAG: hypothetical protein IK051_04945 [Rhodocyclaceae bacterium]|nr:hypothetical protein [Rhodocyclaceae bacterium]
MKEYLHAFLNNDRLHLFWLPAMLVAWSVYALVPLRLGSILLGLVWVSALALALLTATFLTLFLIGTHTSLLEEGSDVDWLKNKLRWLHPLSTLLAALVLALAADMLINWLRGPSDEQEVILRRVYCTSDSNRIPRVRLPQKDGKWCFETRGRDTVIDLPFLGRHEGYDILHTEIPITQSPRPVSLGETLPARWRSYHSIFGVADAYYQITDIH